MISFHDYGNKDYGDPDEMTDPSTGNGIGMFKYYYGNEQDRVIGIQINRGRYLWLNDSEVFHQPEFLIKERLSLAKQNYPYLDTTGTAAETDETPYESGFDSNGKAKNKVN